MRVQDSEFRPSIENEGKSGAMRTADGFFEGEPTSGSIGLLSARIGTARFDGLPPALNGLKLSANGSDVCAANWG